MRLVRMTVLHTHAEAQSPIPRARTLADYEGTFPTEFESRKTFLFYPARPEHLTCDILEVGPGRGDFLLAMAKAYPEKRFVAIEIRRKRCYKLARRSDERGLANILFIQGDARFVIPNCIPENTVASAYILFPDPWPKRRNAFQRLLTTEFLAGLARVLQPGGILTIKTDVSTYADWVVGNIATIPLLEVVSSTVGERETIAIETLYEQRRRSAGETIHTLRWRRTGSHA